MKRLLADSASVCRYDSDGDRQHPSSQNCLAPPGDMFVEKKKKARVAGRFDIVGIGPFSGQTIFILSAKPAASLPLTAERIIGFEGA